MPPVAVIIDISKPLFYSLKGERAVGFASLSRLSFLNSCAFILVSRATSSSCYTSRLAGYFVSVLPRLRLELAANELPTVSFIGLALRADILLDVLVLAKSKGDAVPY